MFMIEKQSFVSLVTDEEESKKRQNGLANNSLAFLQVSYGFHIPDLAGYFFFLEEDFLLFFFLSLFLLLQLDFLHDFFFESFFFLSFFLLAFLAMRLLLLRCVFMNNNQIVSDEFAPIRTDQVAGGLLILENLNNSYLEDIIYIVGRLIKKTASHIIGSAGDI